MGWAVEEMLMSAVRSFVGVIATTVPGRPGLRSFLAVRPDLHSPVMKELAPVSR